MAGKIIALLCFLFSLATLLISSCRAGEAQMLRELIRNRVTAKQAEVSGEDTTLASLNVAIWEPVQAGKRPLVIFSHGFHGSARQSESLMQALCRAGYLVIAPDHKDSFRNGIGNRPQVGFGKAAQWSDSTYKDRAQDIENLVAALKQDAKWSKRIDWERLSLMGHSLGGYTMLGLAGAWPSWKMPGLKAVVALSPYCAPFLSKKTLPSLKVPVMYQGGTRDSGITPFLKSANGAFSLTPAPVYLVEFEGAGHFTWTNFNKEQSKTDLIDHYCLAFLSKYVLDDKSARPQEKLPGVSMLDFKN